MDRTGRFYKIDQLLKSGTRSLVELIGVMRADFGAHVGRERIQLG